MRTELKCIALEALGVLRVQGPDLVSFLQGQLSSDVARLTEAHSLLGGYHNPQGRVIALLRLVRCAPEEILAVLPRELVATVAHRLMRYVLRSRVKLADATPDFRVSGLVAAGPQPPAAGSRAAPSLPAPSLPASSLPATLDGAARLADSIAVCVALQPARWLLLTPTGSPLPIACAAAGAEEWQRLAVSAGEPQVYAATSEEFVAQMLNLDLIGAIAFDKGCYTGQEVIARAHYRGRVKRRLQRFVTDAALPLAPGDALVVSGGRAVRIVDSAALEDGRREFLAVAPLAAESPGEAPAESPDAAAAPPTAVRPTAVRALPLPYALPAEYT
ncbi:MAG TPA: hypothetical protein VFK87_12125 [Steroidobacteraceae bacterium]|nr:hypothetical protein [Steroidobacteraceae bacterium]